MAYKDPEKKRKYAREWVAKRREKWFKENGPCVKCGTREDLELDHIDHKNKRTHVIWSFSKVARDAELVKCQVLCSVCHKDKTATEGSKPKGSRNGQAKLNETQVKEILLSLAQGYGPTEISKNYFVSEKTIRNIGNGSNWKHVEVSSL